MKIRIGTRKSRLALAQTDIVIDLLKKAYPDIQTEIVHISTKGDKILDKPLESIGGKGVFVSEIEKSLLENKTDIAVHSAKDLPLNIADGLEISGVLKRGDYRDCIVLRKGENISNSPDFIIGTSSKRRILNMQKKYPDVAFKNIRGNVDTRLEKLKSGEYDALILAVAGLERLGFYENNSYDIKPFDYNEFLPSACQGIIAIESRRDFSEIIKNISDDKTFMQFETERYVLELLNADCTTAVGAYSEINGNKITLTVSTDFKKIISGTADISERFELAERLVNEL